MLWSFHNRLLLSNIKWILLEHWGPEKESWKKTWIRKVFVVAIEKNVFDFVWVTSDYKWSPRRDNIETFPKRKWSASYKIHEVLQKKVLCWNTRAVQSGVISVIALGGMKCWKRIVEENVEKNCWRKWRKYGEVEWTLVLKHRERHMRTRPCFEEHDMTGRLRKNCFSVRSFGYDNRVFFLGQLCEDDCTFVKKKV